MLRGFANHGFNLDAIDAVLLDELWLPPIARGAAHLDFATTWSRPGGSSDPGMMRTTATREGDDYVIRGHKWFITGAGDTAHFMLTARTSDDPRRGLTAFLYHRDDPGSEIVRCIGIMGFEEHGGHCEIVYDGLRIPAENVLLEERCGHKVSQTRLGRRGRRIACACSGWLSAASRPLCSMRATARASASGSGS